MMAHTIRSISAIHNKGERRKAKAKLDLLGAYQRVFISGQSSAVDREVVLTDLADFCGFYRVTGAGVTHDVRAFNEGMRSAFGRIVSHVRMTADERAAYETAARQEALVNQYEGEL
jgi:hypothetical protein